MADSRVRFVCRVRSFECDGCELSLYRFYLERVLCVLCVSVCIYACVRVRQFRIRHAGFGTARHTLTCADERGRLCCTRSSSTARWSLFDVLFWHRTQIVPFDSFVLFLFHHRGAFY